MSETNDFPEFASMENFELAFDRVAASVRSEVKNWLGKDVYGYEAHKSKHLSLLQSRVSKAYKTDKVYEIERPKQDRSLRTFQFLSMDDRIVYQALGNKFSERSFEELLELSQQGRIFANIPTIPQKKLRWMFRRAFTSRDENGGVGGGQYNLFRYAVKTSRDAFIARFPSPWMIKTDISSFYPSINHNMLITLLKESNWADASEVKLLTSCLKGWAEESPKGIPVGYETSDLISNLYLFSLDKAMSKFKIMRYVDDIYIFVENLEVLKEAVLTLDKALYDLDLVRNAAKTKFICLKSEDDLDELLGSEMYFEEDDTNEKKDKKTSAEYQKRLEDLFNDAVDKENLCKCNCDIKSIRNARTVAYSLYRLEKTDSLMKQVALCLLDTHPNYSYQAITYLAENYKYDEEVRLKLWICAKNPNEPTQLRITSIVALMKIIGYRGVEEYLNTMFINDANWHLQYAILKEISENYINAIERDYIKHILESGSNAITYVYAFALVIEMKRVMSNKSRQAELINSAFSLSDSFISRLAIHLVVFYGLNVEKSEYAPNFAKSELELLKIFIPDEYDKVELAKTQFKELFGVNLQEDFIGHVFSNPSEFFRHLDNMSNTKTKAAKDFVSSALGVMNELLTSAEAVRKFGLINDPAKMAHKLGPQVSIGYTHLKTDSELPFIKDGGQVVRLTSHITPVIKYLYQELYTKAETTMRNQIFICYSHKDNSDRQRIQIHLKPYFRDDNVTVWDDTYIEPGKEPDATILAALRNSKVAILLVSADFMASTYIHNNELPEIFSASQNEGLKIVWISLKATRAWKKTFLHNIQCAHPDPDTPLHARPESDREDIFANIAEYIDGYFKSET